MRMEAGLNRPSQGEKMTAALQIEYVETGSLIPYARNARTHTPEQVAQIAASIREFGWTNPVLLDQENGIVAGHGRVLAAAVLGMASVPAIRLGHLSAAQRAAYVLADNKIALNGGWDFELLALELNDLSEMMGGDLKLIGFTGDELAQLIGSAELPIDLPTLPVGEKQPYQQMAFTLHDDQVATVLDALSAAKVLGEFADSKNENSNGNALARVCEIFVAEHGKR